MRLCVLGGLGSAVPVLVVVGIISAVTGLPWVVAMVAFAAVWVAVAMVLWRRAPTAVLRSLGATAADEWECARLHNLVDGLCATMGLARPTLYLVDSPVPNALALGRGPNASSLVVTSALEPSLDLVELEGVIAHELVHVKRHDTVLAGVAVVVMAPWAAVVGTARSADRVHALTGPGREFAADQRAAEVVRYPPGIASALDVLASGAPTGAAWPPGRGSTAAITRWLWIDPLAGAGTDQGPEAGNLDDTRVRAAAQSLL